MPKRKHRPPYDGPLREQLNISLPASWLRKIREAAQEADVSTGEVIRRVLRGEWPPLEVEENEE